MKSQQLEAPARETQPQAMILQVAAEEATTPARPAPADHRRRPPAPRPARRWAALLVVLFMIYIAARSGVGHVRVRIDTEVELRGNAPR